MTEPKSFKFDRYNKDISDIFWCISARGKNDVRKFLNYIKIENNKIYATNGHIMNIYTLQHNGLLDGIYEVITCKKTEVIINKMEEDIEYPNPNLIIEKDRPPIKEIKIRGSKDIVHTKIIRVLNEKVTIPYSLFVLAYWNMYEDKTLKIYGEKEPIFISDGTHLSVIMPMMVE